MSERLNKLIAGSQWVLFENSAHMAHAEEKDRYLKVLGDFISGVESKAN